MPEWISTTEAARRLGVKRETLYAYVSRGMLTSRRTPGGRASRFDPAEVERLAGRHRSGGRAGSLELVVDSALTLLQPDGHLYYRGKDVGELARSACFEQVAELLWTGSLPTSAPAFDAPPRLLDAARSGLLRQGDAGPGPIDAARPALLLKRSAAPIDRIRSALALASVDDPLRFDRTPRAVAAAGRRILAVEVAGVAATEDGTGAAAGAAAADRRTGEGCLAGPTSGRHGPVHTPTSGRRHEPARESIARRLWYALTRREGDEDEVKALDAALVLLADHEMASSTLAARVAASTWADPYLVVSAGLAVLGGPLHGSVGDRVAPLLREAAQVGAAEAVGGRLRLGDAVVGFGHMVYRERDPRAEALWPFLEAAWPGHPVMRAAGEVAGVVTGTFPNVDFALGALVASAGMVEGSAEAIFAVARSAGWLAHAVEEYPHRLRYRLRAAYTGPAPVA